MNEIRYCRICNSELELENHTNFCNGCQSNIADIEEIVDRF